MGRGETGVVEALEDIRQSLPFAIKGIHSDNGSEFINHHLVRYCRENRIEFSRTRPYKKDDNAHIEQKNWTHVRKIFGWDRLDTRAQQQAMNALYRGPVGQMMNCYQASVKLKKRELVGSKLRRRYDTAMTPLDRLAAWYETTRRPKPVAALLRARARLDPFALSEAIDRGLARLNRAGRGKKAA
jgi:transposase InsO family protein